MTWPPLPRRVMGHGGPIRVLRPKKMPDNDWGGWHAEERVIRVRHDLIGEVAHHTYLHELFHAQVDDLGTPLTGDALETYCDTQASTVLHAMRAALKVK